MSGKEKDCEAGSDKVGQIKRVDVYSQDLLFF